MLAKNYLISQMIIGTQQNKVLYLVPGIMGSTLRMTGYTPSGIPVDEDVWSEDLHQIRRVLGTKPASLASSNLAPKKVIKELCGSFFPKIDVYGGISDFCTSPNGLDLEEDVTFFPFAYDWRFSCSDSASKLVEFIEDKEAGLNREIIILAHSMGGIISRLALIQDKSLLERTSTLVQVASPIGGSAKSYFSLKNRPELNPIFDSLWNIAHKNNPICRSELLKAVSSFDSLYELLPPSECTALMHYEGAYFTATHRDAWPTHLHEKLDHAEAIHRELKASDQVLANILQIIYSDAFPTINGYIVDNFFGVIGPMKPRPSGDSTVPASSALAASAGCPRHSARRGHGELIACSELKSKLMEIFAR